LLLYASGVASVFVLSFPNYDLIGSSAFRLV
jgi:hypothetical protein